MADDADKPDDAPFVAVASPVPPARPFNPAIFDPPDDIVPIPASQPVPLPLRIQMESQDGAAADHVALEARGTAMSAGSANFTVTGNDAGLIVTRAPTTVIGKAVLGNKAALQLAAFSLRASLDAKLGAVGIQDSHPGLVVIQAVDGPIRFD
jgi:hypothetical protein